MRPLIGADQPTLFEMEPIELPPKESAGKRRTQRQHTAIALGRHPLTGTILHPDAHVERDGEGPRCGNCVHRIHVNGNARDYPKCEFYVTHGAGTDCRAWWPACPKHQPREETA